MTVRCQPISAKSFEGDTSTRREMAATLLPGWCFKRPSLTTVRRPSPARASERKSTPKKTQGKQSNATSKAKKGKTEDKTGTDQAKGTADEAAAPDVPAPGKKADTSDKSAGDNKKHDGKPLTFKEALLSGKTAVKE